MGMTYRERIMAMPWIDDVSVEPDGIFIDVKPDYHFPDRSGIYGITEDDLSDGLFRSLVYSYRTENWREALQAAKTAEKLPMSEREWRAKHANQ